VVYDRLVGSEILARIPHGAARFDVGKRCGEPSPTQEEINALLLALARTGKRVVRLKGGIPWCSGAVARRRCTWPGTASRPSWCRASRRPWAAPPAASSLTHGGWPALTLVTGHLMDEARLSGLAQG
jgi:uroporphyrin-III C-methyltransferase